MITKNKIATACDLAITSIPGEGKGVKGKNDRRRERVDFALNQLIPGFQRTSVVRMTRPFVDEVTRQLKLGRRLKVNSEKVRRDTLAQLEQVPNTGYYKLRDSVKRISEQAILNACEKAHQDILPGSAPRGFTIRKRRLECALASLDPALQRDPSIPMRGTIGQLIMKHIAKGPLVELDPDCKYDHPYLNDAKQGNRFGKTIKKQKERVEGKAIGKKQETWKDDLHKLAYVKKQLDLEEQLGAIYSQLGVCSGTAAYLCIRDLKHDADKIIILESQLKTIYAQLDVHDTTDAALCIRNLQDAANKVVKKQPEPMVFVSDEIKNALKRAVARNIESGNEIQIFLKMLST